MKKFIIYSLAFLIVVSLSFDVSAQLFKKKKKKKKSSTEQMDLFSLQVDGMGCPFCAYGLEKKMEELNGVEQFRIEMETGNTTFAFPSSDSLTMDLLMEQVKASGYTFVSAEIKRANGSSEKYTHKEEKQVIDYEPDEMLMLHVPGNCQMCKMRIEKAAMSLYGISHASWDEKTEQLKVSYLSTELSPKDIHLKITEVGHDTGKAQTTEVAYENLPECCKYKRKSVEVEFTPANE